MARGRDQRLAGVGGGAQQFAQVDPFAPQFHLAARHAGDVEQVVDQVHQLVELAVHDGVHARAGGGVGAGPAQQLDAAADRRQRVAQFVRQGGQELGLQAVCLGQVGRQAPQFVFAAAAFGDVVEEDCDAALFRGADAGGVDVVPAAQGGSFVDEAHRLAAHCHPPVDVEPVLLVGRRQFADAPADGIGQPGVRDEGGVGFDETVVAGRAAGVEQDIDHAHAFVHRVEQGAVAFLAGAQFLFGLELAGGVDHHAADRLRPAVRTNADLAARDDPAPVALGRTHAEGGIEAGAAAQRGLQPRAGSGQVVGVQRRQVGGHRSVGRDRAAEDGGQAGVAAYPVSRDIHSQTARLAAARMASWRSLAWARARSARRRSAAVWKASR